MEEPDNHQVNMSEECALLQPAPRGGSENSANGDMFENALKDDIRNLAYPNNNLRAASHESVIDRQNAMIENVHNFKSKSCSQPIVEASKDSSVD